MIDIESIKTATVHFIQEHQAIAPFVVGALAFGESLAIISLFVPATVILFAVGIFFSWVYMKHKRGSLPGALQHIFYNAGVIGLNKRFSNGLLRSFTK